MAIDEAADANIFFADFGESANLYRATDLDIPGATILVDRNVDVISDDAITVTKKTLVHFRKDQLLSNGEQTKLDQGDRLVLLDADGLETNECYTLHRVFSEDIGVVSWYVR